MVEHCYYCGRIDIPISSFSELLFVFIQNQFPTLFSNANNSNAVNIQYFCGSLLSRAVMLVAEHCIQRVVTICKSTKFFPYNK